MHYAFQCLCFFAYIYIRFTGALYLFYFSPSLIALSSKDPILTAFELSWELRRLSFAEHEFKGEYLVSALISLIQHMYSKQYLEYLIKTADKDK